jgi:thioesterase domain-containing protein
MGPEEIQKRIGQMSPSDIRALVLTIKNNRGKISLRSDTADSDSLGMIALRSLGAKRPLFLMDPAGGSAHSYYVLAKHIDHERPVYAFQRYALGGHSVADYMTVEELARTYLAALRTVQAEGPYLLAGYSMGGTIAFEVARQLKADRQSVALLALIDSHAHFSQDNVTSDRTLVRDLYEYIGPTLAASNGSDWNLSWDSAESLEADEQLRRFAGYIWKERLTSAYVDELSWRSLMTTLSNSYKALENYEPRSYSGGLIVFRAMGDSEEDAEGTLCCRSPDLGWQEFCSEPVTSYELRGNHMQIMREPNIHSLVSALEPCLLAAG